MASDSEPADGQARSTGHGFAVVLVLSLVSTAALLVFGVVYYAGSSARIASDYADLAAPANQALTAEAAGYARNQRHDLAAARSDLTREVETEVSFDSQLAEISFPSAADADADTLIRADQERARLIGLQARSTSLRKLRSFDGGARAADAAVEAQARLIRQALGLPPSSGRLF